MNNYKHSVQSAFKSVDMNLSNIDVCIAGSGPAGCIVARQLSLAGLNVMLIDRPVSNTNKFGETLPSAAIRLLKKLGLESIIENLSSKSNFQTPYSERVGGNISFWGSDFSSITDFIHDPYGLGLRINRKTFDHQLREAALISGANFYALNITHLQKKENNWEIELENGEKIKAKWIVDATGRSAKIIKLLGVQRNRGLPLVALYRTCLPKKNNQLNRTILSAHKYGWIYTGKMADQQWVMGFHTTPKIASKFHQDANQWQQMIQINLGLSELFGALEFGKDIFSHDARSCWLEKSFGKDWVACGDALLAFDPIAGQGLFNAIYTGMKAAEVILSSKNATEDIKYTTELNQILRTYENRRLSIYRQEQRWSSSPFWQAHQLQQISD